MAQEGGEWVLVRAPPQKDWWNPSGNAVEEEESSRDLKLTFSKPAQEYTEAVPIGNGRLGVMVSGGVQTELLHLNEDTLWTGIPGNYTNKNAPEVLAEVRKLVDKRKYFEATDAAKNMLGHSPDGYLVLGDIRIEFDESHLKYSEESYHRELDLDKATSKIKYNVGDIEFTREHFVSYPDQVIVTRLSTSKSGSLSFTVSLELDNRLYLESKVRGNNQIIMKGSCLGYVHSSNGGPKGIQFAAVLDIQISNDKGVIHVLDDKKLRVEGSDWAILLLTASSSFDGPFTKPEDSKKDPTFDSLSKMKSVKSFSYENLYARHLDDYQNLFHRVSLQLSKSSKTGGGYGNTVPTPERIQSFQTDEDPSFVELLFQYGRYLLISCSRPGTQVANLQGIWNKYVSSEFGWGCSQHLNINLQMNYWPSLSCNLQECQEPLFDYISSLSINGSKTAKVNYEANGWVAHQVSDIWAKTSPDADNPVYALWPMGGAWLCTHLWEHYTYTMDEDFLKNRAYPLLEGCTSFLLDWLIEGPGGLLETNPSTSPEHMFFAPDERHARWSYLSKIKEVFSIIISAAEDFLKNRAYPLLGGCTSFLLDRLIEGPRPHGLLETNPSTSPKHMLKQASVSYSSTMDIAIIKEVFSIITSAAEVLGRQNDTIIKRVKWSRSRLPPTRIARDGSIMEWAEDFQDPEVTHRHISHLFGLFPGHTISLEKTPDLCKAAAYSLIKRGDEGPAWSTVWKIATWAHLLNTEHAYRMIKHLIVLFDSSHDREYNNYGGLYANLFSRHPPFQLDGNFGFSAAIAEMLVQSTMEDLYLLPALPRDKWSNGCVKGLKARGEVTVNICWKEGNLHEVGLWSRNQNSKIRLHYGGTMVKIILLCGKVHSYNNRLKCVKTYDISSLN